MLLFRRAAALLVCLLALTVGSAQASQRPALAILPIFSPETNFSDAGAIAGAPDGSVYVLRFETAGQRVAVFSSAGELVRTVGAPGSEPGHFSTARDVDVDVRGDLYVTEQDRVQKFDSDGALIDPAWGNGPAESLATGGQQVATLSGQQLRRFSADGTLIAEQAAPAGSLAMDSSETVYVAGGQGVFAIKPDGTRRPIGKLGPQERSPRPDEFSSFGVTGAAVTTRGDLYVNDFAEHRFLRFRTDGTYLATCGQAEFGRRLKPRSLAAASDDTLLLVDAAAIRRFGPRAGSTQDGCLDQLVALARPEIRLTGPGISKRPEVILRSSVTATATIHVDRLPTKRSANWPRRIQRIVVKLRPGRRSVSLRRLGRGRYRVAVEATDAYGSRGESQLTNFRVKR